MGEILKIAIVSDLHCKYSDGKNASEVFSYLTSDLLPIPVERNPVESLKKIIIENELSADLLLCPGDIADKSDKQGLLSGWQYLQELKIAFDANILASTTGNHDVDSRKKFGKDPFDLLKRFSKNFPTENEVLNIHYWAEHFCIMQHDKYDLLIFDSAYSHFDEMSCKESKITTAILESIAIKLEPLKQNNKLKIAMCHHHPIKHSNMDYKDGDSIDKGDDLVRLLEQYGFALIVHGHKHDPRLNYSNSLPVFAAGSFSSMMNLLDLGAQNTFHFIEIDFDKKGIIKSWVYGPKEGWTQKSDTYFPCLTGFGVKVDIKILAQDCAQWFKEQDTDIIPYTKLLEKFPMLNHLIPFEQKHLNHLLINDFSIEFLPKLIDGPKVLTLMF